MLLNHHTSNTHMCMCLSSQMVSRYLATVYLEGWAWVSAVSAHDHGINILTTPQQFQANCCTWNWDKICAIWLIGASLIYQVANLKPQSHKQENAYCPGMARCCRQFQTYLLISEYYEKEIPLEKTTLESRLQLLSDKALPLLKKAGPSELCRFSSNYAWEAWDFMESEDTHRPLSDVTEETTREQRIWCYSAPEWRQLQRALPTQLLRLDDKNYELGLRSYRLCVMWPGTFPLTFPPPSPFSFF